MTKEYSRDWVEHFQERSNQPIHFSSRTNLSSFEKQRIAHSISQFERGESSEAQDYLAMSHVFAKRYGLAEFHEASKLFVQEENYHSQLLNEFMSQEDIPKAKASWTDWAFRSIRHLGEIAWSSRVLMTAEIVAQVYYPALQAASKHAKLIAICERIITDEDHHIEFQTERIALIESEFGVARRLLYDMANSCLLFVTAFVVCFDHHKVLFYRRSFWAYINALSKKYVEARKKIKDHKELYLRT